jgi:hypothetical protein
LNVAGIDTSLSNTAICVGSLESGRNMLVVPGGPPAWGVVNRTYRFETIVSQIVAFLEPFAPLEAVLLEGYSWGSEGGQATDRAECRGILNFHLVDMAKHIYEPAPMTLKKFVLGKVEKRPKGTKSPGKTPIIAAIARQHGLQFQTDDEYDAFALWQLGLLCVGADVPRTTSQRECVDTVLGLKDKSKSDPDECDRRVRQMFEQPVEKPW